MGLLSEDWQIERRFSSVASSLSPLRRFLNDALDPQHLSFEIRDQLILAAHEAATNVIRYAVCGDEFCFLVVVRRAKSQLEIEFLYDGPDFDRSAVPPPDFDGSREGGFGLYLIELCVDSVTYDRVGSGARRVKLVRRLAENQAKDN